MKLRDLLDELLDHLDDEVDECIIDISFKENVFEDNTDSTFIFESTPTYLVMHLLRLKDANDRMNSKPTDELVKA